MGSRPTSRDEIDGVCVSDNEMSDTKCGVCKNPLRLLVFVDTKTEKITRAVECTQCSEFHILRVENPKPSL